MIGDEGKVDQVAGKGLSQRCKIRYNASTYRVFQKDDLI